MAKADGARGVGDFGQGHSSTGGERVIGYESLLKEKLCLHNLVLETSLHH